MSLPVFSALGEGSLSTPGENIYFPLVLPSTIQSQGREINLPLLLTSSAHRKDRDILSNSCTTHIRTGKSIYPQVLRSLPPPGQNMISTLESTKFYPHNDKENIYPWFYPVLPKPGQENNVSLAGSSQHYPQ
jgi:hypothetical protein